MQGEAQVHKANPKESTVGVIAEFLRLWERIPGDQNSIPE